MLENLDRTKLAQAEVDINLLQQRISSGNAILFTGAGFSLGARNILGSEPPMAKELARKLSQISGLDEESDDLMFASEVALELHDHGSILDLLKDNYTINKVSSSHEDICNLPWRRFYTTNYDNSIELSSLNKNKRIESIDISSDPIDYIKKKNVCLHINGKIEGSNESDLIDKIKLSDASYLSADSFIKSKWKYHFNRDLERASAIVFVGYSMYDIDIKKILFDNPEFAEKTYFIVRDGASFQETFIIKKFGHILPIGIDKFSKLISFIPLEDADEVQLESLVPYEIIEDTISIRDADSERFLLYGDYKDDVLQTSFIEHNSIPFSTKREHIDSCIEHIGNGSSIIIQSDLGNGKSIYLEMLKFELFMNGFKVFSLENNDGDYIADIEHLESLDSTSVVVVDDFSNNLDLLDYIKSTRPSNVQFILSERNLSHLNSIDDFDVNFIEININLLDDSAIEKIISIIDNLGAWDTFSSLSIEKKIERIKGRFNSQLSMILLGLLNSPNIKEKIQSQTAVIYENSDYKDVVFAICLCEVVNIRPTSSIISELIDNNEIFGTSLRSLPEFRTLFRIENNEIKSKSSVLALSLLNNSFSETYVLDTLLDIVNRLDKDRNKETDLDKMLTSLLRFRFVEMILPQKKNTLNRYYERLKIDCQWLLRSPHYWVQYAMCRLAFDDYKKAQDYLTTAYEQARMKHKDFYTDDIDTQQARLYLKQALNVNDANKSFAFFNDAHNLLAALPNEGRKFRQISIYQEIFVKKYPQYSDGNKVSFEHAVRHALQQSNDSNLDPRTIHHAKQLGFIHTAREKLEDIYNTILLDRKK
ncbi:TPA: SIR2 family protein [Vibrio vulnificus]|uniref:SIR2 family protein n=1 Tax=Vibrio harveyi group TaxID=717610 RepID=UPI001BD6DA98|nr:MULTISPECIES: SIR2 family protein [Vibrio harveyi group]MBS9846464.1 SIR2 family protein [Vibrio alginolyticus]